MEPNWQSNVIFRTAYDPWGQNEYSGTLIVIVYRQVRLLEYYVATPKNIAEGFTIPLTGFP
jgi:hypothetical protein